MTAANEMPYKLLLRDPSQDAVLDAVVARCAALGPRGAAVFDLDGCLFDNRPRQVQLLRVWASLHDIVELGALEVEHFQDWSLRATLERAGIEPVRAAELADAARPFWERWFFDDRYVLVDRAFPGAARFVRAVASTGVAVSYLTGRSAAQRPSTLENLERFGFPIDPAGSSLWTKDDPAQRDRSFKRHAWDRVAQTHDLACFLDNEPGHVNDAAARFPDAVVVWVRTDHSPGSEVVVPSIPGIFGYLRTTDR